MYQDGTSKSATERAYHIDEYKKSDSLKIDVNYYLLSQIFPIALRICEPIEGIDDVLLAENLGKLFISFFRINNHSRIMNNTLLEQVWKMYINLKE